MNCITKGRKLIEHTEGNIKLQKRKFLQLEFIEHKKENSKALMICESNLISCIVSKVN